MTTEPERRRDQIVTDFLAELGEVVFEYAGVEKFTLANYMADRATTIASLTAKLAEVEQERDEYQEDIKGLSRAYHTLGLENLENHRARRAAESDNARLTHALNTALEEGRAAMASLADEHAKLTAAEARSAALEAALKRTTDLIDSYEARFKPPHSMPEYEHGLLDACQNIRMAIDDTHDPSRDALASGGDKQ